MFGHHGIQYKTQQTYACTRKLEICDFKS